MFRKALVRLTFCALSFYALTSPCFEWQSTLKWDYLIPGTMCGEGPVHHLCRHGAHQGGDQHFQFFHKILAPFILLEGVRSGSHASPLARWSDLLLRLTLFFLYKVHSWRFQLHIGERNTAGSLWCQDCHC